MTIAPRIKLVFDPFSICMSEGTHVNDLKGEVLAFASINRILHSDPSLETVANVTYVIGPHCWEHFRTYHNVRGVVIEEVTPRRKVKDAMGAEPPEWLTDELVMKWRLLDIPAPATSTLSDGWEAVILAWLSPPIHEASTLSGYLQGMLAESSSAPERDCPQIKQWLIKKLHGLCQTVVSSNEAIEILIHGFEGASSCHDFADLWIQRIAMAPLADVAIENPIRQSGLDVGTPRERALARSLPLSFPLPSKLHAKVSERFRLAVQNARLQDKASFEETSLRLNAMWDGVSDELATWLQINPRSMTERAAEHLRKLYGFEADDLARRICVDYLPVRAAVPWTGIGDNFDSWVAQYSRWIRSAFLRRDLPLGESDPSIDFGTWLKEHSSVIFSHHERSYLRVASNIRRALTSGRTVIVVLVDALATHVSPRLAEYIGDELAEQPSSQSNVFVPLPTISEVCKEAVLTGCSPSNCTGDLRRSLSTSYELDDEQLMLASNWTDAERLQVSSQTRLLVYRENRLDDQLTSIGSYRELLVECSNIFPRVARLVARWVGDLKCLNGVEPLLLVTADHGFTFGPAIGSQTVTARKLDGTHRCVKLESTVTREELEDPSVFYVSHEKLHTKIDYLAAIGRQFGSGTMSGWKLSHGGALPEEAIVPIIEWFGDERSPTWPVVSFPTPITRERGHWQLHLVLSNPYGIALPKGQLRARVLGEVSDTLASFPNVPAGGEYAVELQLPSEKEAKGLELAVEITLVAKRSSDRSITHEQIHQVPRARQLTERTESQVDFESMF